MFHKSKKNPHFLQKLINREISGNFIRQGKANSQSSSASNLFKTIPSRCVYQLNNVIDLPGNHVFMGTTRCGQFLLTYSFITHTARSTLSQRNKYQLHWWLFRPGRRAAKVAEVQLFADYAVTSILTIGIAQWPTVNQRLVVYGFCNNAEDYLEEDHRRYYLTITTLPSLDCRDCLTVAASFDEEDMAANWDSCVSFSCLKHGLTIHSLFDVTPPYPKFDFNISLKLNNSVVFNTVNFLHVLSFDLENPKPEKSPKTEQTIVTEEINHRVGQIMTAKYPKEYAQPYDINKAFKTGGSLPKQVMKLTQPPPPPHLLPPSSQPPRASSVFHTKEKSSRQWCIRIPNLAMKPVSIRTKVWRRSIIDQAEKVYAFEESEDGGCEPKFKWYRRKRLADKMYEFCSDEDDEDMENIRPPDKWGMKLPRYKCLSPPKTSPQKCDVIENRLSQSEGSLQQPFTKMILNIAGNDTRYMIQNTDCCKRLMNIKTDADSEIKKISIETADSCNNSKSNNSRLDEPCCDKRHRDMDTPVTTQIPLVNLPKSNKLEETGSDKRHRDMDIPVTIQIPPINLPFCVAGERNCEKKQEPLLKEPVFLSPAAVTDRKVGSDCFVSNPLSEVASLLDNVSKIRSGSDSSAIRDTVSDSSSAILDSSSDTVSNSSAIDGSLIDIVSKPVICDSKNVSCPVDTVSNPSVDTVLMDTGTVDTVSNTLVDNKVQTTLDDTILNSSSLNNDPMDTVDTVSHSTTVDNEKDVVSIDTVSNSSMTVDKGSNAGLVDNVSDSSSTNTDNRYVSQVSNSSLSITGKRNVCNTPNDNITNYSSSNTENRYVSKDTVSISSANNTDNRKVCNTSSDIVTNSSTTNSDNRFVSKDTVSISSLNNPDNRKVCNTPNDSVSNLKATFETSNINHDVRAIIADWEADSISSMSPQSEFSSSVTTCNSPKVLDYSLELGGDNSNERDMTIQRFLEIPPRFGFSATKKNFHHNHHHHHHRFPYITSSSLSDLGMKVLHSNVTRCVPHLSSLQYPPIKMRALQPHNRIRRSCFKQDLLLSPPSSCFGYEKEEELRRKKVVGCSKSEGDFEGKRRRDGKMGCCSGSNKSEVKVVADSFEVKRRREGKVGSGCSGNLNKSEVKVDGSDLKRKKKEGDASSLEEEFVDILDNILGRRTISDCSIQLDRRFIEVDEEMISTITDIEDDDQAVGFHCALPLHVHGSAYAQMQMVSNQKVDKLNVPCVLVRQNSLDIEQLCSKAAEVICECEGFKFWFCDDYDTEIVEVCPLDGSILIVVFMRLNVERVNMPSTGFAQVVVDRRHFYECKCLFVWSTAKQECSLEAFTHLRPVPHDRVNVDGWSPAGKEAERMRRKAEAGFFHLKPTPAIRAFVHRLYDDDDNQTDSALEVQDPTNLMLFRLYPVNSNMKINSNRIVVL